MFKRVNVSTFAEKKSLDVTRLYMPAKSNAHKMKGKSPLSAVFFNENVLCSLSIHRDIP